MKKLTDPRLRKLTTDVVTEAKQTGKPARRALDGQSGYLYGYPTGKTSIRLRPRINGKPANITYKGPTPTAAGIARWLAEQRDLIGRGTDPRAAERAAKVAVQLAQKDTLRSVCEDYLALQERRGQQRTIGQVRKNLERLVFDTDLAGRPVGEIRKSEFVRLLDHVERTRGPRMRNKLKGNLHTILKWFASRSDTFVNPISGIEEAPEAGPRSRILEDSELVRVWNAAGEMGAFGSAVRMLLLCAARRDEIFALRFREVNGIDITIPGSRYKTKLDHVIPISSAMREILDSLPRGEPDDYVFQNLRGNRISGLAGYKAELDRRSSVTGWRLHDCRRSARSLMSRAGISADHAERCLGHRIGGVRGVYDRFAYREEKARALEALARLLGRIVCPPGDNVRSLPARG
jgi:integrase